MPPEQPTPPSMPRPPTPAQQRMPEPRPMPPAPPRPVPWSHSCCSLLRAPRPGQSPRPNVSHASFRSSTPPPGAQPCGFYDVGPARHQRLSAARPATFLLVIGVVSRPHLADPIHQRRGHLLSITPRPSDPLLMRETLTCTSPSWHPPRRREAAPRTPGRAPGSMRAGQFAAHRPRAGRRRLIRPLRRPSTSPLLEGEPSRGRGTARHSARHRARRPVMHRGARRPSSARSSPVCPRRAPTRR